MIETKLGEVKLTKPNYELCNLLDCSKEEVDLAVRSGLVADLCSILNALKDVYDLETALEMWLKAAEVITKEDMKGE